MTVYVDPLFDTTWAEKSKWPYARSCHMTADALDELHAFAARLGLRRSWFQARRRVCMSHYDLTATKRALAVRLGAVEVDRRHGHERLQKEVANDRA